MAADRPGAPPPDPFDEALVDPKVMNELLDALTAALTAALEACVVAHPGHKPAAETLLALEHIHVQMLATVANGLGLSGPARGRWYRQRATASVTRALAFDAETRRLEAERPS